MFASPEKSASVEDAARDEGQWDRRSMATRRKWPVKVTKRQTLPEREVQGSQCQTESRQGAAAAPTAGCDAEEGWSKSQGGLTPRPFLNCSSISSFLNLGSIPKQIPHFPFYLLMYFLSVLHADPFSKVHLSSFAFFFISVLSWLFPLLWNLLCPSTFFHLHFLMLKSFH